MINCLFKLIAASRGFACYLHGFLVLNCRLHAIFMRNKLRSTILAHFAPDLSDACIRKIRRDACIRKIRREVRQNCRAQLFISHKDAVDSLMLTLTFTNGLHSL